MLLGLGVLVLAGLVLGGGAILLLGSTPRPTPTQIAGLPSDSLLPTFATPSPSPAPTPTLLTTPSPSFPPSFPPTLPSTTTPSPVPTVPPTPSPEPTAAPTPVDCAVASTGTNIKELVLDSAHPVRNPIGKVWCIRDVTFHPAFNPAPDASTGYGTAKLLRNNKLFAPYTCMAANCGDGLFNFVPPKRINAGSTLVYQFTCQDSLETPSVNDCEDEIADGMTITIHYEAIAGP